MISASLLPGAAALVTLTFKRKRHDTTQITQNASIAFICMILTDFGHVVKRELADPTDRESVSLGGSSPPVPTIFNGPVAQIVRACDS